MTAELSADEIRSLLQLEANATCGFVRVTFVSPRAVGPGALPLRPMDAIRSCYYLRVMAQDRPGVLSRVTGVLGEHDISIASMIQKGRGGREAVAVVMMTHEARERDMRRALGLIDRLPDVESPTMMIRVEGGPA